MFGNCSPGQLLAADPARCDSSCYPLRYRCEVRYSDLDHGRLSRVALAQVFEDTRVMLSRDILPPEDRDGEPRLSLLRSITLEAIAPADGDAPLEIAAGISAVGRSSHRTAIMLLQRGRGIAVGESVDVTVNSERRPVPVPPRYRAALDSALVRCLDTVPPAADQNSGTDWADQPFRGQLPTRFGDTDSLGHLNNVSVARYHDNAVMAFQRELLGRHKRPGEMGHWWVSRMAIDMAAESFFPAPIQYGLSVTEIGDRHFNLLVAIYQNGRCTGMAQYVVTTVDSRGRLLSIGPGLARELANWRLEAMAPTMESLPV